MITKDVQRLSDFQSTYSRLCEQGEQGGAGVVRMKNPTKNITSLFFAFFVVSRPPPKRTQGTATNPRLIQVWSGSGQH